MLDMMWHLFEPSGALLIREEVLDQRFRCGRKEQWIIVQKLEEQALLVNFPAERILVVILDVNASIACAL